MSAGTGLTGVMGPNVADERQELMDKIRTSMPGDLKLFMTDPGSHEHAVVLKKDQAAPSFLYGLGTLQKDGKVMIHIGSPDVVQEVGIVLKGWDERAVVLGVLRILVQRIRPGLSARSVKSYVERAFGPWTQTSLICTYPLLMTFAHALEQIHKRKTGKDVQESVMRMRKEMEFLSDHLSEEEVLREWRETLVERLHKR